VKSWICKISLTLLAITLGCGDDLQTYLKDHSHSLTEDEPNNNMKSLASTLTIVVTTLAIDATVRSILAVGIL
jgi:hypothetical protein